MDIKIKLPSTYCRICFKDQGQNMKQMSEEIREDFHSLTNFHLVKSDVYSNLVCGHCSTKINDTRKYRDELKANELKLLNELNSEIAFVDTQTIKVESNTFVISDVHMQYEASESDELQKEKKVINRRSKKKKKIQSKTKNLQRVKLEKEYDNLPTNEDGKVICPHCSKPCLRIYIHQHIERVHLALKDYICDRCGRNFYKYSSIESHMNQHMNIQPFKCPKSDCDKSFCNRTSVRTHFIKSHTKESKYICEICAKDFKEKYMLKEHITTKHEGIRFKCTYADCKFEYLTKNGLQKHVESTHDSRLETCEFCGKIFRSGMQIYNHKRLQHSGMKFKCIHCSKRFATAALQKTHEKLHVGQKDHVCKICNSRYHIRRNLKRHIQVAHQKMKFFCKIPGCNAVLCNKDNYRTHIRKVHQSMPPKEMDALLKAIALQKPDYLEGQNDSE